MDEVADDGNGDVPAAGFGLDRLDLLVVPAGEGDLGALVAGIAAFRFVGPWRR